MKIIVALLAVALMPFSQAQLRGNEGLAMNQQQGRPNVAQQQQQQQGTVVGLRDGAEQRQWQQQRQGQVPQQTIHQFNGQLPLGPQEHRQLQAATQAQYGGMLKQSPVDRQHLQAEEQVPRNPVAHDRRYQQVQQIIPPQQLLSIMPRADGGSGSGSGSGGGKKMMQETLQHMHTQQTEQLLQRVNPLMIAREIIPVRRAQDDTGAPITPTTTPAPITPSPISVAPVTVAPVTAAPVTAAPVTTAPVTVAPVTTAPVSASPTPVPTPAPTPAPTPEPTTVEPSLAPTTVEPSLAPSTAEPSLTPTMAVPSASPGTENPTRTAFLPSGLNAYGNDHYQTGPWRECIGWEANDCQTYIQSITSDAPKILINEYRDANSPITTSEHQHRVLVYTSVEGLVIKRPQRG